MPTHIGNGRPTWFTNTSGGSSDLRVNGASTPVTFRVTMSDSTGVWFINRVIILAEDAGATPGEFLGLNAKLTNGLLIKAYDATDVELVDFTDGQPIKGNNEFNILAGVDSVVVAASGDDAVPIRWTLTNDYGDRPFLKPNEYLELTVQDDLSTGITMFRAIAKAVWSAG